jgi:hypothetical protein
MLYQSGTSVGDRVIGISSGGLQSIEEDTLYEALFGDAKLFQSDPLTEGYASVTVMPLSQVPRLDDYSPNDGSPFKNFDFADSNTEIRGASIYY